MNAIRTGWKQASRWQRVAIVGAVFIGIGAVVPREPAASLPAATFAAIASPESTRSAPTPTPPATVEPVVPTEEPTTAPTPVITPVPEPTLAPTPEVTPIPEPTDAPPLSVTKVSLTASVCNGCTASVTIKTSAGAYCTIDVVYNSGSSTAAGLGPKTAGSTEKIKWSWKVGTRTATGTYPIYIDCSKGDRNGTLTLSFKVT